MGIRYKVSGIRYSVFRSVYQDENAFAKFLIQIIFNIKLHL